MRNFNRKRNSTTKLIKDEKVYEARCNFVRSVKKRELFKDPREGGSTDYTCDITPRVRYI